MADKPKFDPNKPFDAPKPKFDPGKPFSSQLDQQRQQALQQSGPQPMHPAGNQDKARMEQGQIDQSMQSHAPKENMQATHDAATQSMISVGEQLAPAMASTMKGAIEAGSHGYIKVPNSGGLPEAPWAESAARSAVGAGEGLALNSIIPGAGSTSKLVNVSRQAGIEGLLSGANKPQNAPDTAENHLKQAGIGALLGGAATAGIEGSKAILGGLKTGLRTIVPESFDSYRSGLINQVKDSPTVIVAGKPLSQEAAVDAALQSKDMELKQAAQRGLQDINPEVRDTLVAKSNEMAGRDKWPLALGAAGTAVALGHPEKAALALAGPPAYSTAKQTLYNLSNNKSTNPDTLAALLGAAQQQVNK